jgi:hypothetical protein
VFKHLSNGQEHKYYTEFISGLCFRIWNLQAVFIPVIKAYNRSSSLKETAIDVTHTRGAQDRHSSLGTLRYYLQFSTFNLMTITVRKYNWTCQKISIKTTDQ